VVTLTNMHLSGQSQFLDFRLSFCLNEFQFSFDEVFDIADSRPAKPLLPHRSREEIAILIDSNGDSDEEQQEETQKETYPQRELNASCSCGRRIKLLSSRSSSFNADNNLSTSTKSPDEVGC
jgi:hypothetical protein